MVASMYATVFAVAHGGRPVLLAGRLFLEHVMPSIECLPRSSLTADPSDHVEMLSITPQPEPFVMDVQIICAPLILPSTLTIEHKLSIEARFFPTTRQSWLHVAHAQKKKVRLPS
jgi:hypothetical protein